MLTQQQAAAWGIFTQDSRRRKIAPPAAEF
jgi:hypothetical protein